MIWLKGKEQMDTPTGDVLDVPILQMRRHKATCVTGKWHSPTDGLCTSVYSVTACT